MPGLAYVIDPDDSPLALSTANGFNVLSPAKFKPAEREQLWASNIDTEGERSAGSKTSNAEHALSLRLTAKTEKTFRQRQVAFEQKHYKLVKEGGVLRVISPDGTFTDWEIRAVLGGERVYDNRFVHHKRSVDEITFVTAPFGEGEEELVGEFEGSGRLLECVVDGVKGSELALARAEITSPEADVYDLKWGRSSRHYSEASTAKSLYAAKELVPLGGATATTATVEGKAGTSVVRQGTLTPNWTAALSTGPMTHEGVFEVLVWVHMPTGNTGEVGIGWEYSIGDTVRRVEGSRFYFAANHPREGKVVLLSLGQVFLRAPDLGDHVWEGRVIGRSTVVGDDLDILDFALRDLEEGNGSVSVAPALNQPAALLARDEFNQGAGNLNEKVVAAAGFISGPKSPGTGADDAGIGTIAWTNPGNVLSSNNAYAVAKLGSKQTSHFLKATKYGFAIPEGSTIDRVILEVERRANSGLVKDKAVRGVKAGVVQATEHSAGAAWPVTLFGDVSATFDLSVAGLTVADVNDVGFGAAVAAYSETIFAEAIVDHMPMFIHYTDSKGQKWVTSGDPVDLAVETTGKTAQRTEVSDADILTGRDAVAGATVLTDQVVGIQCKRGVAKTGAGERIRGGVKARYVDNNNWLFFGPDVEASSAPVIDTLRVIKRVAGTATELGQVAIPDSTEYRAVYLHVDRRGRYFCWGSLLTSGIPRLFFAGQDSDLAAGGALDDGKGDFYDGKTGALANTRNYDNFVMWIPPLDAAIYAGLSLKLGHSGAEREALGGGVWVEVKPKGDYMRLAPAALENRKNRIVFIASPNDPETMGVGFPKTLKVAIYAKPRYRSVPDPA